jgi:predicted enzyme related to lactoylglutathione lyase
MSKGNTICWTDIPVADLDRAIEFYSAVLGSPVLRQSMQGHDFGLLPHAPDNVSGCLVQSPDNKPSEHGPLVYLSVEGRLDQAIQAVRKGGGTVLQDKHSIGPYGFRAVIRDSEGNRIALHSQ